MDIPAVITQLRTYCPALGGRVAGAANFETGVETVVSFTDASGNLQYPNAIVIPLGSEARDNELPHGPALEQIVTETFAVVVEFDASQDRRGQAGADQIDAMRYSLYAALLNWHADEARSEEGLNYAGDEPLPFDRARLFWQFRFSLNVTVTDADGFLPRGDPLTQVQSTVPGETPQTPPIVFNANV